MASAVPAAAVVAVELVPGLDSRDGVGPAVHAPYPARPAEGFEVGPAAVLGTEPLDQLPQNKSDPALAEIGNRLARVSIDADLFVFGTDAPLVARLAGVLKVSFQLVIFFNDRHGSECSAGMADESRPFP